MSGRPTSPGASAAVPAAASAGRLPDQARVRRSGRRGALRLARDLAYVVLGKYGQYVVTLVTVPLTARVLGPEGSGLLALAMSAYFFGSVATDLGLGNVLAARVAHHPRLGALRGSYALVRVSIAAVLGVGWLATVVLHGSPAVQVLALGLLAGGLSSLGEEWLLTGRGRLGTVVVTQMCGRVVYLAAVVVVVPRAPHPWVPVVLLAGCNALASGLSWWAARDPSARPEVTGEAAGILRTGGPVLLARLLTTSYGPGATLIYAGALAPLQLGLFSASDRLVRAAQSLVDALGPAMLSRLAGSPVQTMWRRTFVSMIGLTAVTVPACAAVWAVAPHLVALVYGPGFEMAADVLRLQVWLLPAAALTSFAHTSVLPVLRDTRGMMLASLVGAGVTAVAVVVALAVGSVWAVAGGVVAGEWSVALWIVVRLLRHRRRSARATVHPGLDRHRVLVASSAG